MQRGKVTYHLLGEPSDHKSHTCILQGLSVAMQLGNGRYCSSFSDYLAGNQWPCSEGMGDTAVALVTILQGLFVAMQLGNGRYCSSFSDYLWPCS